MRRTIAAAAVALLVVACGAGQPDTGDGGAAGGDGDAAPSESSEPDGGDVDPDDAGDAGDDDAPSDDDPQEEAAPGPFRMEVLDSFSITDRDEPLVTGRVAAGTVAVGDGLCLAGTPVTVAGIEAFREVRETASAGEDVGILLGGIELDAIQDGMVLEPC